MPDGLVRGRFYSQHARNAAARTWSCFHRAGRWHIPLRTHGSLSRLPVCGALHASILDVCHPGRLPGEPHTGTMALDLFLNPMAGMIEGFRSALLGRPFDIPALALALAVAAALFAGGVAYFEKVERRFADII